MSDLPAWRARTAVPVGDCILWSPVTVRRTYLLSLAVLVTLFVALYPYLGAMEMCHPGECPYATQTSTQSSGSSNGLVGLCLSAVLAASFAGFFGLTTIRGRRRFDECSRPARFYLSPDPPPPRFS
jgi:hypothetical protein